MGYVYVEFTYDAVIIQINVYRELSQRIYKKAFSKMDTVHLTDECISK
jgi:hypothetical protein